MSEIDLPGVGAAAPVRGDNASPFDAIRRVRDDGSEYWSARELMPLMGYNHWQQFGRPIERAMQSAQNQKMDLTSNFSRSTKVSGKRGPAQGDFELSRIAAYLVAMNGDPNKPRVAEAQAYFAIRTRQMEMVEEKVDALEQAKRRLGLLHSAKGLIDDGHLEAKARIIVAQGLGEAPELDPATAPLYAQTFLKDKGVKKAEMGRIASGFGKRLKAAYSKKYGADPKQHDQELPNGQVRKVNSYTEAHRPLMEAIWTEHYENKSVAA